MSKNVYDHSHTVNKPYSNITNVHTGSGDYRKGHYVCSTGIVLIYADSKMVCFDYFRSGGIYSRSIYGIDYSDRGLAIMAGKFVKYIENEFNK